MTSNTKGGLELSGFSEPYVIHVEGDSYRRALVIGAQVREMAIEYLFPDGNTSLSDEGLDFAARRIASLEELSVSNPGVFTTSDGVDHLFRYNEYARGFCEGAGLSLPEAYLLQCPVEFTGCRTIAVRDQSYGLVLVHLEEDNQAEGDPIEGLRLVVGTDELGNEIMHSVFAYFWFPGPGYYYSEKGSNGVPFVTAVDYLPTDALSEYTPTTLDPGFMTFLLSDAGSLEHARELVDKIRALKGLQFTGGFSVTMVEGGKDPKVAVVEFGGKSINYVEPYPTGMGNEIFVGLTFPASEELIQQISDEDGISEGNNTDVFRRRYRLLAGLASSSSVGVQDYRTITDALNKIVLKGQGKYVPKPDKVAQTVVVYIGNDGDFHITVDQGFTTIHKGQRVNSW